MIESIANGLLKGMGVAGWIIGFMAVLGIFLMVCGFFCYAMLTVFGGEDGDQDDAHDDVGEGDRAPDQ